MKTQIINQNNLKTIKELFSEDYFYRVPDYQRGYSWNKEFIELWNDIIRLFHVNNGSRKHYVGMLALDKMSTEHLGNEHLWDTNSYYIVDGQQRITSIIIILKSILEYAKEENINNFDYETIENILESPSKIHRFGYSNKRNDKAEYYFAKRIYEYRMDVPHSSQYLSNINYAAEYIAKELNQFINEEEIIEIVDIILNRLIFNVYYITAEFDVRVTFETMNNRGKPLTNLELLKNRLMYLSTFFDKNDNNHYEEKLQRQIDEAWNKIYDNLNYENSNLSDDLYLKAHWIVYKRNSKEKGNDYIEDILNNEFSIDKGCFYQACCKDSDYFKAYELLHNYIESLKFYSEYWAIVNIPDDIKLHISDEEKKWLKRLSRLPNLFFAKVSTMIVLAEKNISAADKIEFYSILEKFIFIFKLLAQDRKIDMSFLISATRHLLECKREEKNHIFKELINSIKMHKILPLCKEQIIQAINDFKEDISNKNGYYYKWNGLRYFLYEYNDSLKLQIQNANNVEWYKNKDVSIEHILPQNPQREYWQCMLKEYDLLGDDKEEQRVKVINSLGNLLLLSTGSENSSLKNYSFNVKKTISVESGKFAYCHGSRSAIKVSEESVWTIKQIYERSSELFDFMYEHWLKSFIDKKLWDNKVKELNLYNFEYNKLDNKSYKVLEETLENFDTEQEIKEVEHSLKYVSENLLYVMKFEEFFDKNIFHLRRNDNKASRIKDRFTYVLDENLTFFKCGTNINNNAYLIQYNFLENKMRINTWNEYGEYYFNNVDDLPDLLKHFIKLFRKYIKKTTGNDISKFYN